MNKNYMMQMVREVNSTEVRTDEILSNNVFYFDADKGFRQITHSIQEISR